MAAKRMLGKDMVSSIKEELAGKISDLEENGVTPRLDVIRVGERGEDLAYERGARKRLESFGIRFVVHELPDGVSEADFEAELKDLNADEEVHGILILRPLPEYLSEERIERMIAPEKDVDCLSPVNMAKVLAGDFSGFAPCTAEAAIEIGERNGISFAGKNVAIIGRSMVVGRPLAMLLLRKDATVTVCHSKTVDLPARLKNADVVISAAGCAGLVRADMVKDGVDVIDIGINVTDDGKLTGDVDFDGVEKKAEMITPVPGGVGGVTTSILAIHVVRAAERILQEGRFSI